VELCAVLAEMDSDRNFLVAVLPRNKALEHCRQCTAAAEKLAGFIPPVSHRLIIVRAGFPVFVIESRRTRRNFFSFFDHEDIKEAVLQSLTPARQIIVYRIDAPFSFRPLNDLMESLPHVHIESAYDLKDLLEGRA
jgi:hypothetical protein